MRNKKGFTLLELLVAMAIIAVLLALAIFGILQVQKNSRETQRRKALEDINIGINDFYSRYGQYPSYINFDPNTGKASICLESTSCSTASVVVELKNSARPSSNNGTEATTTNSTQYVFVLGVDGYTLAFCREDRTPEDAGTSAIKAQDLGSFSCK